MPWAEVTIASRNDRAATIRVGTLAEPWWTVSARQDKTGDDFLIPLLREPRRRSKIRIRTFGGRTCHACNGQPMLICDNNVSPTQRFHLNSSNRRRQMRVFMLSPTADRRLVMEGLSQRPETGRPSLFAMDAAADYIYTRFSGRLASLARRRLWSPLRSKLDPEDVVQSALRSFFSRSSTDNLAFDDWNAVWALLAVITVRKCRKQAKRFKTLRRDLRREVAESRRDDRAASPLDRRPGPEERIALAEIVDNLLLRFDQLEHREIAKRLLAGEPVPRIADIARVSERTVQRVQRRLRKALLELREESLNAD